MINYLPLIIENNNWGINSLIEIDIILRVNRNMANSTYLKIFKTFSKRRDYLIFEFARSYNDFRHVDNI